MPTDAQRIQAVFVAAADIADSAERAKFLDGACAGDTGLRSRVDALLRAHDNPDSLFDHPAVAPHDPDSARTHTIGHEGSASPDGEVPLGFLAPAGRPDSLGRIGHYEVLQVLGHGGFGIVFRAFDDVLHRVVAVKVLAPQLAATSPARKRFLREARSSAQVRHEHVVQVYEVGEQPLPYIVMEFIPGETLQQRLNRVGPVEAAEVVRVGRQVAEGLAAAHAQDLIHRDIKPGNILLEGGAGRVKITDFGLARAADDASISQSGIIAGTPMYMAPEQAKGERLDQRADLFSVGSVLYQMAAGRPPFRATGTVAVLKRVAEDTPRNIREVIPETPQWLCDIIAKLHAKDPDDRFQSAREVADVLADCEGQLKAHTKLKDYSRIPRSKPPRSGRRKWAAGAAVLLLPMIALAATEFAGFTHLFRGQPAMTDPIKTGDGSAPVSVAQQAPPPLAVAPFDAAQAKAHQEAWAKHLGVPVETINGIAMKLRLIPPGKFEMGSSKEEIGFWLERDSSSWVRALLPGEVPEHAVEITRPFYIGQTEVTVGQFRRFVGATAYRTQAELEGGAERFFPTGEFKTDVATNWLNPGFAQTDDHPVVCVSWNDAVEFCKWLSKQEGQSYRLPTEAEWEYSSGAGSKGRWGSGDDEGELFNFARFAGNSQWHTWPVAGLKPNAWGLGDTLGNVEEWCQDVYDGNYYKASPTRDPSGPGVGGERVVRGGAFSTGPVICRPACRNREPPGSRNVTRGFRVVQDVSPAVGFRSEAGANDKPASPAIAPFTDADVQRIAALPAAEQVGEVRKEMMRRNPGFDGKVEYKIEDGVVTELRIGSDQVTDVAPIRVFNALRVLELYGIFHPYDRVIGRLADLSPLKGMNLSNLTELSLANTKIGDTGLTHFKDCKNLTRLVLTHTPVTNAGLANFEGCTNLQKLYLKYTQVDDAGLARFKDCKDLQVFDLGALNVTDEGLAYFKDCKSVKELWVNGTKVTDVGLAYFKGCTTLTHLHLSSTPTTDAALDYFKDCQDLRFVVLQDTRITDAGLVHLKNCKRLALLNVVKTQVTPAAIDDLTLSFPKCRIEWGGGVIEPK